MHFKIGKNRDTIGYITHDNKCIDPDGNVIEDSENNMEQCQLYKFNGRNGSNHFNIEKMNNNEMSTNICIGEGLEDINCEENQLQWKFP